MGGRAWKGWLGTAIACVVLTGCNVGLGDKVDDAVDDAPGADDLPGSGDLPDVSLDAKICGDQTLGDLLKADAISDDCRAKVESFLPEPQSSFESRLLVLGSSREPSGARTLYVIGADASGNALFTEVPSQVSVSVRVGGELRALSQADVSLELVADGDLLSLGVVNDYSASMRDEDLDVVSEIETDLFTYLPHVYEAEVTQFSSSVDVKQAFTSDEAALLSAVAIDAQYERASTALLDGMGTAVTSLVERERPLRVLLVSTDGAENASKAYSEQAVIQSVDAGHVVVIMLGALFADVDALQKLAGDRGIYVYARGYTRLKTAVKGLLESLDHIAAIHLPADADGADEVTVSLEGQSVTAPLTP